MKQELIHVHIGPVDGDFPVRKYIEEGLMAGMVEYQKDANTIAWVHMRWCSKPVSHDEKPLTPESCDYGTDWRKFLHDHWDKERNMLIPEYAEDFMKVFISASAAYMAKQNGNNSATLSERIETKPVEPAKPAKPQKLVPDEIVKTKHHTWTQLSLF